MGDTSGNIYLKNTNFDRGSDMTSDTNSDTNSDMNSDARTYLTFAEAARYLSCSESRIKDLVQAAALEAATAPYPRIPRRLVRYIGNGFPPAVGPRRNRRIVREELDQWMRATRA